MVSFLSAAWALGPTIVTADASVKAATALKSERRSMVSSLDEQVQNWCGSSSDGSDEGFRHFNSRRSEFWCSKSWRSKSWHSKSGEPCLTGEGLAIAPTISPRHDDHLPID